MKIFGERLGILVADNDTKQKALAKLLNVSEGTLSNYIHNTYEPSLESVIALAKHFHVSTDYLLGLTESREPPLDLTEEEQEMIKAFRSLHRTDRDFIVQSIQVMLKKNR